MRLKQLFCRHNYRLQIEVKACSNILFEQRIIKKCSKCGKTKVIDKVDVEIWNNKSINKFIEAIDFVFK